MDPKVATSPPRLVPIEVIYYEPITHRTRSRISALSASRRTFPSEFLERWAASEVLHGNQWAPLALSVIDTKIGESLEHSALRRQPRLSNMWNTFYSNNIGRLCQVIGTDPKYPTKELLNGTNTFHIICYEDIPLERRKVIDFSKVFCNFRSE